MRAYFLWLAKFITVVVVILFAIPAFIGILIGVAGLKSTDIEIVEKKKVAVVEVAGIIESSKETLKELYGHAANEDIKGIVLRINSPGGAVGPSQAVYDAIRKLREKKPIVAVMEAVAASGGIYVALGASEVLAQPGTITGSIGVVYQVPNFSDVTDKVGFKMVSLKAGELKDAGNPFKPLDDKTRTFLEGTLKDVHEQFIRDVAEARGIETEAVRKFADGRIILGEQAKEYGLVDGYGDIYDAARAALKLANVELKEGEEPELVFHEDKLGKLKQLLQSANLWIDRLAIGAPVQMPRPMLLASY